MNIPYELYGEISKYLFLQDMLKLQIINKYLSELQFINKTLYERVKQKPKILPDIGLYESYSYGKILHYTNDIYDDDVKFTLLDHEHVIDYEFINIKEKYSNTEILKLLTLDKNEIYRLYIFEPVIDPNEYTPELYYDDDDYDQYTLENTLKFTSINTINYNIEKLKNL
jgi:DNA-directed RNA polymerase subunit H (RpoH/RPB5)